MTRACEGCDQPLVRRPKAKDAARFCSKACYGRWKLGQNAVKWATYRDEKAREQERLLVVKPEVDALRRIAKYVEKPRLTKRPCRMCAVLVIGVGEMQRSCQSCTAERLRVQRRKSRQGQSYRAGKLKYKSIRRAREAIEAEVVVPQQVFARDGWKCQLCGVDTPRRLRGSYEPNAPELDHIVPLSKGGGHTWANVQCACRACNSAKGASLAA